MSNTPWDLVKLIMRTISKEKVNYADKRLLEDMVDALLTDRPPSRHSLDVAKKWGLIDGE
jgi:hypothetical protein